MNTRKEIAIALVDALDAQPGMLLGWTIPAENYGEFLAAIDKAAIAAGGMPTEEVSLAKDAVPTESEINRHLVDEREGLLAEADRILG